MKALITLLCGFTAAVSGFGREFTDTQGRKLEGELVSVSGGMATIKRAADGKVFTLPAAQFSDADQKFMGEFAASNVRHSFDVKTAKTRLGKTKSQQGVVTMESEEWAYKITLTNKSSGDLEKLRVDYWIFRRDDDGKNKSAPRVRSSGSAELPSMRRSQTQDFQTKSFVLNKQQLQADFYYPDGTRNTQKDSVGGIALRIFQGDKEIFQYASDNDLLAMTKGSASLLNRAASASE